MGVTLLGPAVHCVTVSVPLCRCICAPVSLHPCPCVTVSMALCDCRLLPGGRGGEPQERSHHQHPGHGGHPPGPAVHCGGAGGQGTDVLHSHLRGCGHAPGVQPRSRPRCVPGPGVYFISAVQYCTVVCASLLWYCCVCSVATGLLYCIVCALSLQYCYCIVNCSCSIAAASTVLFSTVTCLNAGLGQHGPVALPGNGPDSGAAARDDTVPAPSRGHAP